MSIICLHEKNSQRRLKFERFVRLFERNKRESEMKRFYVMLGPTLRPSVPLIILLQPQFDGRFHVS